MKNIKVIIKNNLNFLITKNIEVIFSQSTRIWMLNK